MRNFFKFSICFELFIITELSTNNQYDSHCLSLFGTLFSAGYILVAHPWPNTSLIYFRSDCLHSLFVVQLVSSNQWKCFCFCFCFHFCLCFFLLLFSFVDWLSVCFLSCRFSGFSVHWFTHTYTHTQWQKQRHTLAYLPLMYLIYIDCWEGNKN